jgi:hypothetical protein
MQSSIDALVSAGMRSTDFVSPKSKDGLSTASPEQFEAINAAIVAGFSARTQKLLVAPTKALSETDKSDKRYWQQQIGARRNDFKRALEKREGVADQRAPQPAQSACPRSPCIAITARLPARSCKPSTFWVTIRTAPGGSAASSRASAQCAALGTAARACDRRAS